MLTDGCATLAQQEMLLLLLRPLLLLLLLLLLFFVACSGFPSGLMGFGGGDGAGKSDDSVLVFVAPVLCVRNRANSMLRRIRW